MSYCSAGQGNLPENDPPSKLGKKLNLPTGDKTAPQKLNCPGKKLIIYMSKDVLRVGGRIAYTQLECVPACGTGMYGSRSVIPVTCYTWNMESGMKAFCSQNYRSQIE